MYVTDWTTQGYFLGSMDNPNASFINTYWNGAGQTDTRMYMNGARVSNTPGVSNIGHNGLFKCVYTLTSTQYKMAITTPRGTIVSNAQDRTNPNATFPTGGIMILRLGYLPGASINLKSLKVIVDGRVVF